jgi:hypothetical protein
MTTTSYGFAAAPLPVLNVSDLRPDRKRARYGRFDRSTQQRDGCFDDRSSELILDGARVCAVRADERDLVVTGNGKRGRRREKEATSLPARTSAASAALVLLTSLIRIRRSVVSERVKGGFEKIGAEGHRSHPLGRATAAVREPTLQQGQDSCSEREDWKIVLIGRRGPPQLL